MCVSRSRIPTESCQSGVASAQLYVYRTGDISGYRVRIEKRYWEYLHEHMGTMLMMNKDPMDGVDVLRSCIWTIRGMEYSE